MSRNDDLGHESLYAVPKTKNKAKAKNRQGGTKPQQRAPTRTGKGVVFNTGRLSKGKQKANEKPKEPVRQACSCQGTVHEVIINCTECGNIVCEAQGEGPCFFCGSLVTKTKTVKNREFFRDFATHSLRSSRRPDLVRHTSDDMVGVSAEDQLQKAIKHRDRLLTFAREKEARTVVIDDQGDFYENPDNQWLTDEQRDEAWARHEEQEAKLNERRAGKTVKVAIDIQNRTVMKVDTDPVADVESQPGLLSKADFGYDPSRAGEVIKTSVPQPSKQFQNSFLRGTAADVYDSIRRQQQSERDRLRNKKRAEQQARDDAEAILAQKKRRLKRSGLDDEKVDELMAQDQESKTEIRPLQDDTLYGDWTGQITEGIVRPVQSSSADAPEVVDPSLSPHTDRTDKGMCLSMHQPWASLLVRGIKCSEGRGWPTDYRGRLWIASTAKPANDLEVAQIERNYVVHYGVDRASIPFPLHYPSSALLGCVDINDCVTQEEYKKNFSDWEPSESDYLFICSHPRALHLPQPIRGSHKIWRLQPSIVKKCRKGLYYVDADSWKPKRPVKSIEAPAEDKSGGGSGGKSNRKRGKKQKQSSPGGGSDAGGPKSHGNASQRQQPLQHEPSSGKNKGSRQNKRKTQL